MTGPLYWMVSMVEKKPRIKCFYTDVCYLAEALKCYGYKTDCVLYTPMTDHSATIEEFHRAINELISRTQKSEQAAAG